MKTNEPKLSRTRAKSEIPTTHLALLFASVALGVAFPVHGQSSSEAMLNFHSTARGYVRGTAGWTFQTQTPLSVTSLGCLASSFGLFVDVEVKSVSVGLWTSDGSLLRSCSVTTNSTLVNNTRYEPISAVLLMPTQTYYVGASGVPDGFTIVEVVNPSEGGSATMAPQVQLGFAVWVRHSIFEFPVSIVIGPGAAFAVPNFQFTVVEPALWLSLSVTNGAAVINVSGSSGVKARLEWVADVSNWTAPHVLTTNAVPYTFVDLSSSNSVTRFYRAVDIP